ncbi:MAG: hypothetical protein E7315_04165 [Clostridiales bacterium]|nr:hypothetical protein [Clostridiales bacterium]
MDFRNKQKNDKVVFGVIFILALAVIVALYFIFIVPTFKGIQPDPSTTPKPQTTVKPVDGIFFIEDKTLEAQIKKALSLDNNTELTKEHMLLLEEISYTDTPVSSLYGLQFAYNLKSVNLYVEISTIDYITKLNIRSLKLKSDSSLQWIMPKLSEFAVLNSVDLTDCGIVALIDARKLTSISTLILDNNPIFDTEQFKFLTSIRTLSLNNCNIKDVSFLKNNVYITHLSIKDNPIKDYSPLDTMPSLEECNK